MQMDKRPEPIIIILDSYGIYIPQIFAMCYFVSGNRSTVAGVDDETISILKTGPTHADYWGAWEDVETNAVLTDAKGVSYNVFQDGDCWLIPVGMVWDHPTCSWFWPEKETSQ